MKRHIPNFITSLNVASGFFAIIAAMANEFVLAAIFIIIAMFFDYIDGFVARMLNAKSEVGKELDSLGDVISFGVAPAIILAKMLANINGITSFDVLFISPWQKIIIVLFPVILAVFAALRLARFNVFHSQSTEFVGLPVPSVALYFIAFPLIWRYGTTDILLSLLKQNWFYIANIIIFSWLMVSNLKMFSLKINPKEKSQNYIFQLILLFFSLILLFSFAVEAIPMIIIFFILLSIIRQIFYS